MLCFRESLGGEESPWPARVGAMFKFLQAGQLFNKKSLKLKYI